MRHRRRSVVPSAGFAMALWICIGGHGASVLAAGTQPGPASPPVLAEETEGNALIDAGKLEEGLERLARAEAQYARTGDRTGRARVALKRGTALRRLSRTDDAVTAARRALSLAGDDRRTRQGALTELGVMASTGGNAEQAESWLQQAVALAGETGDGATEAVALRTLGQMRAARSRPTEALQYFERSVSAADRAGALPGRVTGRMSVTVALLNLARYDDAIAWAQQAFDIARGAAGGSVRADALFNLAQAHAHIWNLDRAAELWTEAIEAYRAAGNLRAVALATKQSVDTSFARGEFDRAVADGERAVELLRQFRFDAFVPEALARLALSEARRRRLDAARAWAERARAAVNAAPEPRHVYVHNDLGLVAIELGELEQAVADFARVRDVATRVGDAEYEWRAWWGTGRARTAARDWAVARDALERAIAIVERLRQTIPEAGMRATFMTNRVGVYETLVEAMMGSAQSADDAVVGDALQAAERARSRALADLLAEARTRPSAPALQEVRARELAFGERLSAAGRLAASASDAAAREAALTELRALEQEYDDFVVEIRRDNAGYAALAHPRAMAAGEISKMLAPDEALVEFLIAEKRGFAWVVRSDSVRGYEVPGQDALAPRARLLQALVAASDTAAIERLGADLHATLLAPAEPALRGVRRLIVVPDGALQRVPFALFRSGGRWLIDYYTLTMAPSATVLDHLRQFPDRRADRPLLAIAAPDVPATHAALFDLAPGALPRLAHASQEAADAGDAMGAAPGDTHAGSGATEQVLKSETASGYRVVHLAAHAVVDEVVPRRSAVLLTPGGQDDGLLRVSEIANLSLGADLVVLAACQSNVGRLVRGEGLLSLGRAFLHAGARAVVATAWMVDDRDTAWLMRTFYQALADGLAPDEALRYAQRRAIDAGGRLAAPAHWGAFLVIGEARTPVVDPTPPSQGRWLLAAAGVLIVFGGLVVWARGRSRRSSGSARVDVRGR